MILSRKRLTTLAIAAGVSVVAAIGLVALGSGETAPPERSTVFPELAGDGAGAARTVRIETRDNILSAVFNAETGWIAPERGGFPVDAGAVRQVLLDLQRLETIAPRTSKPDWHSALDLDAPEAGGAATRVTVQDEAGKIIADLLVGKRAANAVFIEGAESRLYIRRPAADQTFLAAGRMNTPRDMGAWLDLDETPIERKDIAGVTVQPADGSAFTLERAAPEEPNVTLLNIPEGREVSFPAGGNRIAYALASVDFEDVAEAENAPTGPTTRLAYRLFDGTRVDLTAVKDAGEGGWLTFTAEGPQAEKINAALGGWAFKAPAYAFSPFQTGLEDLLAPLPEPLLQTPNDIEGP